MLETDRKFTAKLLVSQTVSLLRLFSKLLSLRKVSKHLSYVEELNDCLKYVQVPETQRLLRAKAYLGGSSKGVLLLFFKGTIP